MGLVQEFKEFALKGNMVDLAVGIIIGAAFGVLINSLVNDIIMPPIGKLVGGLDFSNYYASLSEKVDAANAELAKAAATQPGAGTGVFAAPNAATRLPLADARKLGPVIAYGNFITLCINFVIVALAIFMVIKLMNRMRRKEAAKPEPPPGPTPEQKLLAEIRDILKQQRA